MTNIETKSPTESINFVFAEVTMKVLMMMLAALTLFSTNAQAMRYDDKDRESENVEDRRHPIYSLPADQMVQVCEKGYTTSYLIFKNKYGSIENAKALGVKAALVTLKISVNRIKSIPKGITPAHPQFPLKCMAGAQALEDVAILCGCSAQEVQATCEDIVASLNDGGFAPCIQQK